MALNGVSPLDLHFIPLSDGRKVYAYNTIMCYFVKEATRLGNARVFLLKDA